MACVVARDCHRGHMVLIALAGVFGVRSHDAVMQCDAQGSTRPLVVEEEGGGGGGGEEEAGGGASADTQVLPP